MTNEAIEAAARAMEKSLAWDIENDVYAGEMTHEERCKVARAAAPALMEEGARLALEAVRRQIRGYADGCFACGNHEGDSICGDIDGIIRALDPAVIVKGAGHDRD